MNEGSPQRIILLDTDAASNLQRGKLPDAYREILLGYDIIAISWITEAEWRYGLALNENQRLRERFETWMQKVLRISQDEEITRRWADLAAIAKQKRANTKFKQNDVWVAATAVRHNIPLMTQNRSDFKVFAEHGGLRLEPPL